MLPGTDCIVIFQHNVVLKIRAVSKLFPFCARYTDSITA